jgi:transcriptional regulator with XRE-family HTH domain
MQLRQQVRDARETRGLTVRALADVLGMTHTTLKFVLYCRQPPSKAIRKRLTDWLTAAPGGAAVPAEPFRPNGAEHIADTSEGANGLAA